MLTPEMTEWCLEADEKHSLMPKQPFIASHQYVYKGLISELSEMSSEKSQESRETKVVPK
jgi:hypothetical protein